jgi:hypothetical protein
MISMEFILIISVKSIIFHRIIYFDEVIISVIKVINKEVKEIITPVFVPTADPFILLLLGST